MVGGFFLFLKKKKKFSFYSCWVFKLLTAISGTACAQAFPAWSSTCIVHWKLHHRQQGGRCASARFRLRAAVIQTRFPLGARSRRPQPLLDEILHYADDAGVDDAVVVVVDLVVVVVVVPKQVSFPLVWPAWQLQKLTGTCPAALVSTPWVRQQEQHPMQFLEQLSLGVPWTTVRTSLRDPWTDPFALLWCGNSRGTSKTKEKDVSLSASPSTPCCPRETPAFHCVERQQCRTKRQNPCPCWKLASWDFEQHPVGPACGGLDPVLAACWEGDKARRRYLAQERALLPVQPARIECPWGQ